MENMEKMMFGMAGDLRRLRDHVVALPDLRPTQSPATGQDMHRLPTAPLSAEDNVLDYPVCSHVCNVMPDTNKATYTYAGGRGVA